MHIECVRVLNVVNVITARVSGGHSYEYVVNVITARVSVGYSYEYVWKSMEQ